MKFVEKVSKLLMDLGAKQHENAMYRFTIETQAGILHIDPTANRTEGPGTIFTRFDNPKLARKLVGCNEFSGKWNFHYFKEWNIETALADFTLQLQKVL